MLSVTTNRATTTTLTTTTLNCKLQEPQINLYWPQPNINGISNNKQGHNNDIKNNNKKNNINNKNINNKKSTRTTTVALRNGN